MIISPEFRSLIPPLQPEEREQLEANLRRDGCRDPVVVWKERGILLDGHNRVEICERYGIEYRTVAVSLADDADAQIWIIRNQFGRRNLSAYTLGELTLKLKPLLAEKARERQAHGATAPGRTLSEKSPEALDTREELARASGLSSNTISKVELISKHADEQTKADLRANRTSIHRVASDIKREQRRAKVAASVADVVEVETDLQAFIERGEKFGTIYADPPWKYGNQATRAATDNHYPTQTIEEICALPIAEIAAEKAHLHLWTTNAFLFDARRVMEAWGFTYKSCFVWVKPQMGIGNYWRVSHEFMLLGTRGEAPFAVRNEMSWRELPRGRHSEKPDQVREIIERASPGPRIELYARERSPRWSAWGNQVRAASGLFQ